MVSGTLSVRGLDEILALQFLVAWAGEGRCEPKRLGWWDSDLIDEAGGGDLFQRLLPNTHRWASLEAARAAARRTDAKARAKTADPDYLRTLFFLGYDVDEQLNVRLLMLKTIDLALPKNLPFLLSLEAPFSSDALAGALTAQAKVAFETSPSGRHVKGKRPLEVEAMVRQLAGALVPLAKQYPMPFYTLER